MQSSAFKNEEFEHIQEEPHALCKECWAAGLGYCPLRQEKHSSKLKGPISHAHSQAHDHKYPLGGQKRAFLRTSQTNTAAYTKSQMWEQC